MQNLISFGKYWWYSLKKMVFFLNGLYFLQFPLSVFVLFFSENACLSMSIVLGCELIFNYAPLRIRLHLQGLLTMDFTIGWADLVISWRIHSNINIFNFFFVFSTNSVNKDLSCQCSVIQVREEVWGFNIQSPSVGYAFKPPSVWYPDFNCAWYPSPEDLYFPILWGKGVSVTQAEQSRGAHLGLLNQAFNILPSFSCIFTFNTRIS